MADVVRMEELGGVSHVAGAVMTVDGRYVRQLCKWCGARIMDMDLQLVSVPMEQLEEDGAPRGFAPDAWIKVQGTNPTVYSVIEPEEGKYPRNACMANAAKEAQEDADRV